VSIRLRVALVFTLALAVAFGLGSWLFISELRSQLLKTLDATLTAQLAPYRKAASASGPYHIPGPETFLIQVIGRDGQVVRLSSDASAAPMLTAAQLGRTRSAGQLAATVTTDEDRVRVVAKPVPHTGAVAVAGLSLDDVRSTLGVATAALAAGGAVFVLLGGLGAYWLAAAALSPVERMRRQVASISARDAAAGVQVPRTRDELAALAGTMNDLLARLHEALARQRGFVSDASHELRTPLAVLGAELELAGRPGRSRDELALAVAAAEEEVARLTRLTNDLLMLAGSDEGRLPVRLAQTRMRDALQRCVERAASRAAAAGVGCVAEAPPGLVALIDRDRIEQAVGNLIDNALRFAPRGTAITVSARARGYPEPAGPSGTTGVIIEVADSGPGFPAAFLPHAFERFRRPDTGRARSDGGAGLGLAIVAAIARAHGGTASVRNREAGGAIVTLDLPAPRP
jgi:signal transduction histidine kinase